jgi:quercetin dioxygenase-like cupin family protein
LSSSSQAEHIIPVAESDLVQGAPAGVELRAFASAKRGATAFSTGLAIFAPGGCLPYHIHSISEAITVIEGEATVFVEGRSYRLVPFDSIHVPAHVPHQVANQHADRRLTAHTAFGSATPDRQFVSQNFPLEERGSGYPAPGEPENLIRLNQAEVYELSENAYFTDLFARRLGSVGICGGYGRFLPGASLPCHIHDYDESITIVTGSATCLVQGRKYELSDCGTAYIPKGLPHRFINTLNQEMAMIWVYAGDEPDRRVVDNNYCSGVLPWPGVDHLGREETSDKAR